MSMLADDSDVKLMLALRDGDESAFDGLFARWARPLLHYLERIVRDRGSAEELVQETFVRVYRARERYVAESKFSTWLYRIATNLALNELRRPSRRSPHASAEQQDESSKPLVAALPPPDEVAHARRLGERVELELEKLPERQRMALWLSSVEGLSYAEVAEALETTEKSVKALVHRARAALIERLGRERG
jgi:RNA polymerase sigma-70 factor (ECF subfamily)